MSNLLCPPSLGAVDVERQNPRRGDTKQEKKIPKVTASGRIKRKDSISLAVTWEDQMGPIFVRVTDSSNSKAKKTNTTRRKKPHSSSSTAKKQTDDRRYTDADPLLVSGQPHSSQSLLVPGQFSHRPITLSDRTPLTLFEMITQHNEKEVTASLAKMNLDPQQ